MGVTVVRTLPLRVAPAPGEAIDSWLERIAHRCNVTWQELRITQGRVIPAKTYADSWTGRLTAQQCTILSMVTGVDPDALRSIV